MHIPGYRLRNFEIRMGLDSADLSNNAVCYKQLHSMLDGTTVKFNCREALYGSWVSLNKTDTADKAAYLQLKEVRVYACE